MGGKRILRTMHLVQDSANARSRSKLLLKPKSIICSNSQAAYQSAKQGCRLPEEDEGNEDYMDFMKGWSRKKEIWKRQLVD